MKFDDAMKSLDSTLAILFKYELHAFVLLVTGVFMALRGMKEEGFAVIGSALTIFKGKFGGGQ